MRKVFVLMLTVWAVFASEPTKKVLFSCKSSDAKAFEKMLDSISHLSSYYDKKKYSYDIVTVAQGECVKFMLSDTLGTEYEKEEMSLDIELKIEKLKSKARFEQCAVTLQRKQIPHSKVRKIVKIVPSATISTVDYQLDGYALLP